MDYVLVHGTTQSPAGWQRLAGALTRRGNRVQAVDLPTGQPELLAADYAGLAAGQVAGTMDHPVVVAHSGGCLLLPAIAREVGGRRLVWLAGYIPGPAGGPSFAGEIKAAGSEMFSPEWRSLTEPPTADPVVAAYFLFMTVTWPPSAGRYRLCGCSSLPRLTSRRRCSPDPWRPQRMCCRRPTVRSGRSGCTWPYVNAWDVNRWRSTAATAPTFRSPKPSLKSWTSNGENGATPIQ
jgi:Alpha/beta hydrolase family